MREDKLALASRTTLYKVLRERFRALRYNHEATLKRVIPKLRKL